MLCRKRQFLLLSSLLLLVVACAGSAKKTGDRLGIAKEWTNIKLLLPGDAVAILSLSSLNAAQAVMDSLTALTDEESPQFTDLMTEQLPLSPDLLNRERPLAIGISLRNTGMPTPVMSAVLPVRDEEAALAELRALGSLHTRGSGRGYIAVSMASHVDPADALSGMTASPPVGDLALRVDLQTIIHDYRFWVDQALALLDHGLSQTPQLEGTDFRETAMGWLRELLDSAEQLNLSLEQIGPALEVDLQIDTSENIQAGLTPAPEARALIESMRCLPREYPALAIQSVNLEQLVEWVSAINMAALVQSEAMPTEEEQQDLLEMMAFNSSLNVMTAVPNWTAFGMGESGIEWIQLLMPKDVDGFMQRFQELERSAGMMSKYGVTFRLEPPSTLAGHPMQTVRVAFDPEQLEELDPSRDADAPSAQEMQQLMTQLFGGQELTFRLIGVKDKDVVILIGHPEEEFAAQVLKKLRKRKRKLPLQAQELLSQRKWAPTFYFDVDLRGIVEQVDPDLLEMLFEQDLERSHITKLQGGPPAKIHAAFWASPRKYQLELFAQPRRIMALFQELEQLSKESRESDL